jgi:hypothetical protein
MSDLKQTIAALHADLDAIEAKFPGREDVAGRVRVMRHSLRLLAGEQPDVAGLLGAITDTIADLQNVTKG